jgi:hypothetical protein
MDRVHAHLRAYLEAVASLPGGELSVRGGIVQSTAPIGWPMFNGALAVPEAGSCDAAAEVAGALAALGRPWFWWALPDTPGDVLEAAAAAGAADFDQQAPWMEARIADLPERAWIEPARLLGWRDLPWRQWTAFLDGEPVAVTLLFYGGGVAGLFGIGTKPSARRRAARDATPAQECGEEWAGFFSSPEGEPLYRSLGFAERGWVSRWLGGFTGKG